jgi:acetyl esterase/lipase
MKQKATCRILYTTLILLTMQTAISQTVIPLYKNGIPNAIEAPDEESSEINKDGILIVSKVSRPTLSIYLPPRENRTGAAVIICPGGGYWILAAGHEGADVAKRFNEMGVAAFVLKYRIPDSTHMTQPTIAPLQDAQRAIQLVRENAASGTWTKKRIGIKAFQPVGI